VALAGPTWADGNATLTVKPQAPLAAMTRYSVVVTGRAADGVPLESNASFSYTTEAAPDITAPTLASSTPANAAMNVALNTALSLTFSEAMSTASVTVASQPALVLGDASWSSDGRTVTWLTPGPLSPSTAYTLTVDGADRAGNPISGAMPIVFSTTTAPDTEAPTVVGTTPPAGAVGVPTNSAPSLSFSEPMDVVATRAAITISPDAGIAIATDVGMGATQFTLNHPSPFATSTPFAVTVGTGARDLAGNPLAQPFTFTFTTGTTADTTAPTIVSVTPANLSQGAAFRPTLSIVFSEAMDPSATQQAVSVSTPLGVTGTPRWSAGNTRLDWTFGAELPVGTQVQWQVSNTAKDLAGNTLAATRVSQFTVRRRFTRVLDTTAVTTAQSVRKELPSGPFQLANEFRAGDAFSSGNNGGYRAILTFSLQALPSDLIEVESVRLRLALGMNVGGPLLSAEVVVQTFRQALPYVAANAQALYDVIPSALLCNPCSADGGARYDVPFFSTLLDQPQTRELLPWAAPALARGAGTAIQFRVLLRAGTASAPMYTESIGPVARVNDYVDLVSSATSSDRPQLSIDYTAP
jgi:methionine-rich copper-binding protein CopC